MAIILDKTKIMSQQDKNVEMFGKIIDLLTINEKKEAVILYNSMTTTQQKEYHRYLSDIGYNPWKHWLALPFTKGKKLYNLNK